MPEISSKSAGQLVDELVTWEAFLAEGAAWRAAHGAELDARTPDVADEHALIARTCGLARIGDRSPEPVAQIREHVVNGQDVARPAADVVRAPRDGADALDGRIEGLFVRGAGPTTLPGAGPMRTGTVTGRLIVAGDAAAEARCDLPERERPRHQRYLAGGLPSSALITLSVMSMRGLT